MKPKPVWMHPSSKAVGMPLTVPKQGSLEERVIAAIRTVFDPEIPINLYDLGLIYTLKIEEQDRVFVRMTLTAPGCPVAGILPGQVQAAIETVDGVAGAQVELVWDPPWTDACMSDAAKLELGLL